MRWSRAEKLACVMATLAVVIAWSIHLGANGYANNFYSAAAWAGSQSWNALLWGSVDPEGFISVDKPPLALWAPALLIKVFGLHPWSVILPQVLMGGASAALIFAMVRGALTQFSVQLRLAMGSLAVLFFVLTPVAALMFRYNNPDALLALLMTGSAGAALRAIAHGRLRWLAVSGVLLGLGFLTKQLQVALIFPALYLAVALYFGASWRRRAAGLATHFAAFVGTLGLWAVPAALVSPASRPFFGGSKANSFIELTLGYNGLARVSGHGKDSSGILGMLTDRVLSLGRLFAPTNALQWSYFAFVGLVIPVVAYIVLVRKLRQTTSDATLRTFVANPSERDVRATHATLVLAYGWFLTSFFIFSWMKGIFHSYYLVGMMPPMLVAVFVGLGIVVAYREELTRRAWIGLAVLAVVTLAWQYVLMIFAKGWMRTGAIVAGVAVVIGALLLTRGKVGLAYGWNTGVGKTVAALTGVAFLAIPFAATAQTNALPHKGSVPKAPYALKSARKGLPDPCEPDFSSTGATKIESGFDGLRAIATSDAARWPLATVSSYCASLYELATERPVMAIGGWDAVDPVPTLDTFKDLVRNGHVRYFIPRYPTPGGEFLGKVSRKDKPGNAQDITTWVIDNFQSQVIDGLSVFDLSVPKK